MPAVLARVCTSNQNVLLGCRNFVAKLADVGLAKKLTHYHGADDLNTFIDTHELPTFSYAAPEASPCGAAWP